MNSWGTKRTCANCAARFYDLNRGTGVCPKCDAPFDIKAITKRKRVRATDTGAATGAAKAKKLEAAAVAAAPKRPKPAPAPDLDPDNTAQTVAQSAAKGGDSAVADLEKIEGIDESDDDDEEDNLIEDASELGEDDDDVADVIGKVKDEGGSA